VYSLARAPPEDDRRRTDAVGVEVATPRAALGVYQALGVEVSITSPRTRTVTALSRRQPDAEGYPRHRAWPPYADGHPRHIGFFYFIFIFSLSYYFILCFYYLFTSMNYVKNGSIF
jgi:hypothetical protein